METCETFANVAISFILTAINPLLLNNSKDALLIGGFFPKNRSNTNKTLRGETVGYKTKGN